MKNKEIEELLNKAKDIAKYGADGKQHTRMFNQFEAKALLSYIEQLETDYKEAIESVTWWRNRYNAVKRYKKQLENNRDKALKIIDSYELGKYDYSIPPGGIIELRDVLKGDSDENK